MDNNNKDNRQKTKTKKTTDTRQKTSKDKQRRQQRQTKTNKDNTDKDEGKGTGPNTGTMLLSDSLTRSEQQLTRGVASPINAVYYLSENPVGNTKTKTTPRTRAHCDYTFSTDTFGSKFKPIAF
jgi:hypothetical protein